MSGIVADGPETQAERRPHDPPHEERGQDQDREGEVVVGPDQVVGLREPRPLAAEQIGAQQAHALVAAGQPVELEKERVEDHAEGEGQHPEVDLDVAHAEGAHRRRHHRGGERGRGQDQLHVPHAQVRRQHRAGVGADADEERVPEGDEPGGAEEQVQPQQHHPVGHEGQHERDVSRPAPPDGRIRMAIPTSARTIGVLMRRRLRRAPAGAR